MAALLVTALLFAALGCWQLCRLAWKEALIAHVALATTAPPVSIADLPPGAARELEYRRIRLAGRYIPASTTLVAASTELGTGYWDMVAMRGDASTVWVNRGFLPAGSRRANVAAATPAGPTVVVGLLRKNEPNGTWLRDNQASADRWYSRDIPAMARARHIGPARPDIFVDAQAETPAPAAGAPVPGLTVLRFPNNHLSYAITWFALALLSMFGVAVIWRRAP